MDHVNRLPPMVEASISHFPALGLSFSVVEAESGAVEPWLQKSWEALVVHSDSPEAVFQTPAYFEFISAVPNIKNTQKLVLLRETDSHRIVGVVPLRAGRRTLSLALGGKAVARLRLKTTALLGSIPLAPHDPAVLEMLFDFIFEAFPQTSSIAMQAIPAESDFYRTLTGSSYLRKRYGFYIKDGWRTCQTTPLPGHYAEYLARFKAKKRYNLQRQIKLLERCTGPLRLTRIDGLEHIPLLLASIRQIALPHAEVQMMNEAQYKALVQRKIALCYVLHGGDRSCAVVIGIRSHTTYHVHNILYDQSLATDSPGTSILHLAIEDLIEHQHITLVDYGYGDPQYSQQSSNIEKLRSQVFVYQRTWANRLLLATYSGFGLLVDWGKRFRSHPLRKPRPA